MFIKQICKEAKIPRPGLSGALFVKRSGTKKRERKTDKDAQKLSAPLKRSIFAKI